MKPEEITAKQQAAEPCKNGSFRGNRIPDNMTVSRGKALVVSILSLSLLTVMAGAAVAPALGVIREYFADSSPVLVQISSAYRRFLSLSPTLYSQNSVRNLERKP